VTSEDGSAQLAQDHARNVALLTERLGDPGTVASLLNLLDNIDTLSGLLEITSSFIGRSEEILDNVASSVKEITGMVEADGPTMTAVKSAVDLGKQAVPMVEKIAESDALGKLADSRALEPETIDLLISVVDSVRETQASLVAQPISRRISMMRLPMMMRDRDFNRGIDFVLRVVTQLGWNLRPEGPHGVGPGTEKAKEH
jgi:hypothetical protein